VETQYPAQEIAFRYQLGAAVATKKPAVTILVNGGEQSRAELLQSVRLGWPIIVLSGTGQLADEIAALHQDRPDFIAEPALAEIMADGNISVFPVDGEIEELERLIHRQLRGDNTLKLAWGQFAAYDQNANRQQKSFRRLQFWIIIFGVLGTLLALLQTSLELQIKDARLVKQQLIDLGQPQERTWSNFFFSPCQSALKPPEEKAKKRPEEQRKNVQNLIQKTDCVTKLLVRHGWEKDFTSSTWFVGTLKWLIVAIPVLITILIAVSNRFNAGQKWIWLRSTAETLKSEIFRYRTQAGIYHAEQCQETSRETKLAEKIQDLNNHLIQTEVNMSALRSYQGPLPPQYSTAENDDGLSVLSPERYLKTRLEDQLDYYVGKTERLERQLYRLQWGTYILGGVGTFIAAYGWELWIALTTGLVAALTTYLGYQQVEERLRKYNQAAMTLTNVRNWWAALSVQEQAQPENIDKLVSETEEALGREFSEWTQKMQETLMALKEKQAKAAEKAKAQLNAKTENALVSPQAQFPGRSPGL